jgi:hypothetical protein
MDPEQDLNFGGYFTAQTVGMMIVIQGMGQRGNLDCVYEKNIQFE